MGYRIVTITSQFGGRGGEIARLVSANLGIARHDEDLTDLIARESGFDVEFVKEHAEDVHGGWLGFADSRDCYGNSYWDALCRAQEKVICGLAQAAPCVIVGRCADHILRDDDETLSVFVFEAAAKRAEHYMYEHGCSEEDAIRQVRSQDRARTIYYQVYLNRTWGAAENYHLCLDSGRLSAECCARIIEMTYRD